MKFTYAVGAASTLATLATAQTVTCVDGVHIVVARASLENPGFGVLGSVKNNILSQIPNSDAVAVPYPATIIGPPVYQVSVGEGTGNMTELVEAYGDACPGKKMVLMGYSQGAQVVGDTLLGNATDLFPMSNGLPEKYISDIVAVVLMGDPTWVNNQSFNVGNATRYSFFPRGNTQLWTTKGLVNKTVSYCDAGDTYCDSGANRTIGSRVHGGYVQEYGSAAVEFVVEKYLAAGGSVGPNGAGNTSMTGTGSMPSPTGSASTPTYTGVASALQSSSQFAFVAALALATILVL